MRFTWLYFITVFIVSFMLTLSSFLLYQKLSESKADTTRNLVATWLNNEDFEKNLGKSSDVELLVDHIRGKIKVIEGAIEDAVVENAATKESFIKKASDQHYPDKWTIPRVNWETYVDVHTARCYHDNQREGADSIRLPEGVNRAFSAFSQEVVRGCSKGTFKDLNNHSKNILNYLVEEETERARLGHLSSTLKPIRIYLVTSDYLIVYPAPQEGYKQLTTFKDRPWYLASLGKFPNYEFNIKAHLTHTYSDVESRMTVRTLWQTFLIKKNENGADETYSLFIDFLMDAYATPPKFSLIEILLISFCCGLVVASAFTFLPIPQSRWTVLRWVLGGLKTASDGSYWHPLLERASEPYIAGQNGQITIGTSVDLHLTNRQIEKIQAGVAVDGKFFSADWKTIRERAVEDNTQSFIRVSRQYDLSWRSKDRLRAVELWRVRESKSDGADIGLFEVRWNDIIYDLDDIQIETIFWDESRGEKYVIDEIMQQIENMLLKADVSSFDALIDRTSKATIQPIKFPSELGGTELFRRFLNERRDFTKRKLHVTKFDEFTELYMYDVYAVCRIHFLRRLRDTGHFHLLAYRVEDRIFVEGEEGEFGEFYNTINETYRGYLTTFQFRIIKFGNQSEIPKHDFAVVKKQNNPLFILFNFDSGSDNAGWISWRGVDKIFYSNLYNYIKNLGFTSFVSVEEYLRLAKDSQE